MLKNFEKNRYNEWADRGSQKIRGTNINESNRNSIIEKDIWNVKLSYGLNRRQATGAETISELQGSETEIIKLIYR